MWEERTKLWEWTSRHWDPRLEDKDCSKAQAMRKDSDKRLCRRTLYWLVGNRAGKAQPPVLVRTTMCGPLSHPGTASNIPSMGKRMPPHGLFHNLVRKAKRTKASDTLGERHCKGRRGVSAGFTLLQRRTIRLTSVGGRQQERKCKRTLTGLSVKKDNELKTTPWKRTAS